MSVLDRDWRATGWWWTKYMIVAVPMLFSALATPATSGGQLGARVLGMLMAAYVGLWVWHRVWRGLTGGLEALSARL